jgi:hypothetical protein
MSFVGVIIIKLEEQVILDGDEIDDADLVLKDYIDNSPTQDDLVDDLQDDLVDDLQDDQVDDLQEQVDNIQFEKNTAQKLGLFLVSDEEFLKFDKLTSD